MTEKFPKLVKDRSLHMKKQSRSPNRFDPKKSMSRQ